MFAMKKNAMNPHRLAVLAMMTAVVFAVNFPRIIIPLPTGGDLLHPGQHCLRAVRYAPGALGRPGFRPGLRPLRPDQPYLCPQSAGSPFSPRARWAWRLGWCSALRNSERRPPTAAVWPPHWLAA
ncbi:hypothetical protein M5E87_27480 [Flavonifractor plautii]|nr:hypothetical protein M5E87_27480 [Flavonifractor plautii]